MNILITDCDQGLRLYHPSGKFLLPMECSLACPYMPRATSDCLLCACRKECDCCCFSRRSLRETSRFPALPALSAVCVSGCERYVYQLSTEADCVHTRHLGSGELLYACKVGVFPRDMKLRPQGQLLLVAGGASGEVVILQTPDLIHYATFHAPGCCCSVQDWQGGLAILCAVENQDIQTSLLILAPHKIRPVEVLRLEGQPGGFCVCPDRQTALVGALDGLMRIDLRTGEILWNLPNLPHCTDVSCQGDLALAAGDMSGQVQWIPLEQPWLAQSLFSGGETQACFV